MNDFNKWWDEDDLTTQGNPFADGTPAYWAWEGWNAGVKTEREACAKLADEYATWGGSNFRDWFKKLSADIRARGDT